MNVFSTGWSEGFDGPGRRWVVYLKGCDLRCRWCASPESWSAEPEMLFYPERGGSVAEARSYGAVSQDDDGGAWLLDRERCAICPDHSCVTVWRHPAFELAGQAMPAADVVRRAEEARPLFGPDGGVTFGGGEPSLQADEVLEAVSALRERGIHTAIETNAGEAAQAFIDKVDLLICDLKCVDSATHSAWTGGGNAATLANLRRAACEQQSLWIRIPLVPGFNDSDEEMTRIAEFLSEIVKERASSDLPEHSGLVVEILRLHHLGEPKYAALGRDYPMAGVEPPSMARAENLTRRLADSGVRARVVG
jgi:glycyl-radical enzyme activating protein